MTKRKKPKAQARPTHRWDDGASIHVDENGRPIAVCPDRADYPDYIEYWRAAWAFRDKVEDYRAKTLQESFFKALRAKTLPALDAPSACMRCGEGAAFPGARFCGATCSVLQRGTGDAATTGRDVAS